MSRVAGTRNKLTPLHFSSYPTCTPTSKHATTPKQGPSIGKALGLLELLGLGASLEAQESQEGLGFEGFRGLAYTFQPPLKEA